MLNPLVLAYNDYSVSFLFAALATSVEQTIKDNIKHKSSMYHNELKPDLEAIIIKIIAGKNVAKNESLRNSRLNRNANTLPKMQPRVDENTKG
jgi:hypothetical protein